MIINKITFTALMWLVKRISYYLLDDWILESMARLFLHSRILQCSRFFGADVIKTMHFRGCPCPGSCGLTKEQMRKSQKILRKKAKKRRSKIPKNNIASAN